MKNRKARYLFYAIVFFSLSLASCVSQKKMKALQVKTDICQTNLLRCDSDFQLYKDRMSREQQDYINQRSMSMNTLQDREQQIKDLKVQLSESKSTRDKQLDAVGNLTVLSKEANANIDKTLSQLAQKDRYVYLLQAARNKTDS